MQNAPPGSSRMASSVPSATPSASPAPPKVQSSCLVLRCACDARLPLTCCLDVACTLCCAVLQAAGSKRLRDEGILIDGMLDPHALHHVSLLLTYAEAIQY